MDTTTDFIAQVVKSGNSRVITIPQNTVKFLDLHAGDMLRIHIVTIQK